MNKKHTERHSSDQPPGVSDQHLSYRNYRLTRGHQDQHNEPITISLLLVAAMHYEARYSQE